MKTTTNKKHIKNAPDFDAKLPVTYEGQPAEIIRTDLNDRCYPIGAIIDNTHVCRFTEEGFSVNLNRELRLENLWPEPIEGYEMEACGWGGIKGANHDGFIACDHSYGILEGFELFSEDLAAEGYDNVYYIKLTKIKDESDDKFWSEIHHVPPVCWVMHEGNKENIMSHQVTRTGKPHRELILSWGQEIQITELNHKSFRWNDRPFEWEDGKPLTMASLSEGGAE